MRVVLTAEGEFAGKKMEESKFQSLEIIGINNLVKALVQFLFDSKRVLRVQNGAFFINSLELLISTRQNKHHDIVQEKVNKGSTESQGIE